MLARLAAFGHDWILQWMLAVAITIASLSLPLWGGRFDFIALWFGSDAWSALVLLFGCLIAIRTLRLRGLTSPAQGRLAFDIQVSPCHHGLSQSVLGTFPAFPASKA
jgi:hypothetical protein